MLLSWLQTPSVMFATNKTAASSGTRAAELVADTIGDVWKGCASESFAAAQRRFLLPPFFAGLLPLPPLPSRTGCRPFFLPPLFFKRCSLCVAVLFAADFVPDSVAVGCAEASCCVASGATAELCFSL